MSRRVPLVVHDPDELLTTTPSVRRRLLREQQVADLLGIAYDRWMQAGLFPIAYTVGDHFRPTPRRPGRNFLAWNEHGADQSRS